jgi:hypothetical protein
MAGKQKTSRNIKYAVHPGVQKAQDWLARLAKKTGKTLEEWLAAIEKSGHTDPKARQLWLKKEHGFGTMEAMWLAGRAEGRGLEWCDGKAYLAAADKYVEALYAGPKAGLWPTYEKLMEMAATLGKNVTASPCKTFVPLYRRHVFAQIKPTTRTRIDLGLALAKAARKLPKRLIPTGGIEKGDRISHRMEIFSLKDVDGDVKRWMKLAYELDA